MHLVSGGGGGAAVASFVGGLNRLIPPTTTITSASTGGAINGGPYKPATSTLHQLAPNGVTDQISIQPASITTTTHRVGSKGVVAVEDTGKVLEMVGLPEFEPSEAAPTDSGKALFQILWKKLIKHISTDSGISNNLKSPKRP